MSRAGVIMLSRGSFAALMAAFLLLVSGLSPALHGSPAISHPSQQSDITDSKSGTPLPQEGRAVERPDHDGPYKTGTMVELFTGSTKNYAINLKLYYPAQAAGDNATADTSGAPYPVILQMPYAGGDETAFDFIDARIVSWGFICVCVGQNQSDLQSGNSKDVNEIIDRLGTDNLTPAHHLLGMVNAGAIGISGHSRGGAFSVIDGWAVARIRAVQAMAPALDQSDVDAMAPTFSKPYQAQVGRLDSWFHDVSLYSYRSFKAPKDCLDLAGVGHGGPFQWDLAISFFFRHLLGLTAYDTFLYGDSALNDTADKDYFLNFTLPDGRFFPPSISVQADDPAPVEDQTVHFNVTYDGYLPLGNPRGTFKWDFLSDGSATESGPYDMNASHSYSHAGTVLPSVWYELGGLELGTNRTLVLTVSDQPPVASAGGNRTAAEDEALHFSADARDTPSDNFTLRFFWDFGDGAVSPFNLSHNASHSYDQSGRYTVNLTVEDDEGARARDALTVTVRNLPPSTVVPGNITARMDDELLLAGEGDDTPSDVPLLQYRWDFGDGGSSDWGEWPSASHTYTRAGDFTAVFFVMDDDGAASNATTTVHVSDIPPTVAITAPAGGAAFPKDEQVEFGGSGGDTPSDTGTLEYGWDFGDGNSSGWAPSGHASHTYTRGGNYTAFLTVRDREGAEAGSEVILRVVNQPPTVRIISPAGGTFDEDQGVPFTAAGDDTVSDVGLLNYTWEINGARLYGQAVEASFTTEGSHDLTVTVTDPEGASSSSTGTVVISDPPPVLAASLGPLDIYVNSSVNFSATADDTPSDRPTLDVLWDFGDNSSFEGLSGSHEYTRAGAYTARVTATDDEGARTVRTFAVRVGELPRPPSGGGGNGTAQRTPLLSGPPAYVLGGALVIVLVAGLAMIWRGRRQDAR